MIGPVMRTIDQTVGLIAGKYPSTWLDSTPAAFNPSPWLRNILGFSTAGDPTDGLHLVMYPSGFLNFANGADLIETVVNPLNIMTQLFERKSGVSTGVMRPMKLTVLDSFGTELWSENFTPQFSNWQVTLFSPPSPYGQSPCGVPYMNGWCPSASFADGAYSARIDVYTADGSAVELTKIQHWIVDHSGWSLTPGTLVVYENGPSYTSLNSTTLSLAAGSKGYSIRHYPGLAVISGIPSNSYSEIALTDGQATRLFPYSPGAIQNIWDWKQFDDPSLLSGLDPTSGKYTGTISSGSSLKLIGAGFTHHNPVVFRAFHGRLPSAPENDGDSVRVTFTWSAGNAIGGISYVSTKELDVVVPDGIPVGAVVSVQVKLNGTLSNARQFVAAEPQTLVESRRQKINHTGGR